MLIARTRLADELLDRAIWGHDETVEMLREEGRSFAKRRRTDARLGLAMLARLDRMVETRARAGDERLAQIVAGDWPGFLTLFDAAEAVRAADTAPESEDPSAETSVTDAPRRPRRRARALARGAATTIPIRSPRCGAAAKSRMKLRRFPPISAKSPKAPKRPKRRPLR